MTHSYAQHDAHLNVHIMGPKIERFDALAPSDELTRLQHAATHCNILQHTATHCNTHVYRTGLELNEPMFLRRLTGQRERQTDTLSHLVRDTAPHCNTFQHTLQHTATRCNTLQYAATHCNTHSHTFGT